MLKAWSNKLFTIMASGEWTSDRILGFLELYFQETSIWNPKDSRHKDRNEVFDAWKRIEEALDYQYSITELKKKRENLMSTYRKLCNKVRASKMSGGDVFKPDWFAYDIMAHHLNDVYCPKAARGMEEGDETISENETLEYEESAQSEDDVKDFQLNPEYLVNQEMVVATEAVINTSTVGGSSSSRSTKKRKHQPEENGLNETPTNGHRLSPPNPLAASSPDECALFCELLSLKLKSLSENFRETAMHEINNIMYNLKMQQNCQQSSHVGFYQPSSCLSHYSNLSNRSCLRPCCMSSPSVPKSSPNTPRQ